MVHSYGRLLGFTYMVIDGHGDTTSLHGILGWRLVLLMYIVMMI